MIPEPAEVETTEDQQAIAEGRAIIEQEQNANNWRLGELARQLHEAGQTDQQIADLWGCSRGRVAQCRMVWNRFGTSVTAVTLDRFSWVNWREMVGWSDADDLIEWAEEMPDAMFRDVVAFRNLRCHPESPGEQTEPSTETPPVITTVAAEPDPPIIVPKQDEQQKDRAHSVENPTEPSATKRERPTTPQTTPPTPATVSPPSLKKATTDALKALKTLSEAADTTERRAAAKKLRKLADELDPPKRVGRFVPPTVEQVAEYCRERGNGLDPEYVHDYYNTQGWKKTNGQPVTEWRGCVRTFEKKERERANGQPNRAQQRQDSNRAALTAACRDVGQLIDNNLAADRPALPHEAGDVADQGAIESVDTSARSIPF